MRRPNALVRNHTHWAFWESHLRSKVLFWFKNLSKNPSYLAEGVELTWSLKLALKLWCTSWRGSSAMKKLNYGKLLEGRHRLWKSNVREAEVSSPWSDWADWGIGFTEFWSMRPSYSKTGGLVLTPDFGKSDVIWRLSGISIRAHESQATGGIKQTTIGKFLMSYVLSRRLRI